MTPDPALDRKVDEIVATSRRRTGRVPEQLLHGQGARTTLVNLRDNHELYCAGHMFEAAVAHHQATGKITSSPSPGSSPTTSIRCSAPPRNAGCGHPGNRAGADQALARHRRAAVLNWRDTSSRTAAASSPTNTDAARPV
jgi:hypothetical protein